MSEDSRLSQLTTRALVVEGVYPALLVDEWDRYRDEWGTESIRPGDLNGPEQANPRLVLLLTAIRPYRARERRTRPRELQIREHARLGAGGSGVLAGGRCAREGRVVDRV